jgi:hypothetical protein
MLNPFNSLNPSTNLQNLKTLKTLKTLTNNHNELQNLLLSLVYWPITLGYQNKYQLTFWLIQKINLKKKKMFLPYWQSEMLLQCFNRNLSVIVHTPQVFSLVDKTNLTSWTQWRDWNKKNASTLIFGFSTGRCGFKPYETKSFIAGDTLVRAALWFFNRFYKKLSPIKVSFMGENAKFLRYFNRLKPLKNKQLKYKFYSFADVTPIAFNGCRLSHLPRKRYRRHPYQVRKVVQYIKKSKY